jgi:hypothetical protein
MVLSNLTGETWRKEGADSSRFRLMELLDLGPIEIPAFRG